MPAYLATGQPASCDGYRYDDPMQAFVTGSIVYLLGGKGRIADEYDQESTKPAHEANRVATGDHYRIVDFTYRETGAGT